MWSCWIVSWRLYLINHYPHSVNVITVITLIILICIYHSFSIEEAVQNDDTCWISWCLWRSGHCPGGPEGHWPIGELNLLFFTLFWCQSPTKSQINYCNFHGLCPWFNWKSPSIPCRSFLPTSRSTAKSEPHYGSFNCICNLTKLNLLT